MEKRKAYYVSRKNVLTWLSVLLILCSAVVRLVLHCGKGTGSSSATVYQILLPVIAAFLLVLIVLFQGKTHFYRTAIPVALYCISEIGSVGAYGLWHRLLVWLACIVFAVYYWETVSGKVSWWSDRLILGLFTLGLLFVRVIPEDLMVRRYRTAEQWLQDVPTLCAILGIFFLVSSIHQYLDGKYHKTWGDRSDGRRLRSLDPMACVSPYLMPTRGGASNYIRDTIDVTETDKYIRRRRREGMTRLTITQIYLAAYCRVIAKYPGANRFLSGQKVYSRDGDIVFNMIVKKEMTTEGGETAIKLHLTPSDTLDQVSEKLDAAVDKAKKEDGNGFDQTAAALRAVPSLVLKFAVWLLKTLDYFGLLPAFLVDVSPFHGSIFFTSMASLGIPAIYHHLYDFGNMPVFCCLGGKYRKTILHDDGTAEERKFMDVTFVCDERICDGFYFATVLKHFRRIMAHPELLENPPEEVKPDIY